MKTANVSYTQLKSLCSSKNLLLQYTEESDSYNLFAIESNISWETRILKDSGSEQTDFETNYKSTANAPLEYRSIDGLPKYASAMFVDNLSYWVDGSNGNITIPSNQTGYCKTHFSTDFKLNGVDMHWEGSNFGDYITFEVGVYNNNDTSSEDNFIPIAQFSNQYRVLSTGTKTFSVDTVKTIPSSYSGLDVYIRTTYVNSGATTVYLCVNLLGYK